MKVQTRLDTSKTIPLASAKQHLLQVAVLQYKSLTVKPSRKPASKHLKFASFRRPHFGVKIPKIYRPQLIRHRRRPGWPRRLQPRLLKAPGQIARKLKKTIAYQLLLNYFLSFFYTLQSSPSHVVSALLMSIGILAGYGIIYDQIFKDLPDPIILTERQPEVSSRILSKDGEVLFRIYDNENRTIIPLSEMPPEVIFSTIAIEDKDFFKHSGFSISGIIRAAVANTKGEKIQGGSTITQQLVKNRLLSTERTWTRKIRELILSIMVEDKYTKEQILEMYLNQVAYGGSTYGIEEAAQRYFGKSARELNLAEASLLAGLPKAPSVYSPFGANPELAFLRQEEVLRRMQEDGYISSEQAEAAINHPLKLQRDVIDIKAPHFVMYVRKLLADMFGEEMLQHGGLIVRTTLDLPLQERSQEIVTQEVDKLAQLKVTNGAALITNPKTGEVLAMVGSRDYFDFEHDGQVNVALRPRQPGSSIKPLTYALAIEKGATPLTVIEDSPVTYQVAGSPPYSPKNYDGTYHGRVTLREALASSYNVPAVKMLAGIGVSTMLDRGAEMGITTWGDRSRFGLSLTLGGGEVLMTDMAALYGVLANGGNKVPLDPILEVTDYKGEVLYRNECALDGINCVEAQVLDPSTAYTITHILSDNNARTPAFGPFSTLYIPNQEVAVKTGTTNNLRDNWTIGYTTDRVVAVWVGNNDNTPMSYVASGITGASPIWNSLMRLQLNNQNPHVFPVPDTVTIASVCFGPEGINCGECTSRRKEVFAKDKIPSRACLSPTAQGQEEATRSGQPQNRIPVPREAGQQPNRDRLTPAAQTGF